VDLCGFTGLQNETWSYTPAGQGEEGAAAAARAAAAAEVVVLSVATQSAEGNDRKDLSLGTQQEALIEAVLAAAPGRVVVVVRAPGAVSMPWSANITALPAILLQLMPGQATGGALASVLFGDTEPTARLPLTFPHSMAESWLENETSRFPGMHAKRNSFRFRIRNADYSQETS
jgi:beta-glucosidase